jgi:hypothetical protein
MYLHHYYGCLLRKGNDEFVWPGCEAIESPFEEALETPITFEKPLGPVA